MGLIDQWLAEPFNLACGLIPIVLMLVGCVVAVVSAAMRSSQISRFEERTPAPPQVRGGRTWLR